MPEPARVLHRPSVRWLGMLASIALVAGAMRHVVHHRAHVPGREGWVATDPDSHHMLRRVERVFREGLPVAERDPEINFPHGAMLPAAPYFPLVTWCVLAPFAPDDVEQRHVWLEQTMASLPLVCGVLTSLVAAWLARKLAGDWAGLGAGLCHACSTASIAYSNSGIADYHALVTLLTSCIWLIATLALANGALEHRARGAALGALAGALAGLAMGTWVASLVHVIELDIVLAVLIWIGARRGLAGLASFGFTFHAVALLVLMPAVISSPWRIEQPWAVIELSWFHASFLALGAAVFVPLFVLRAGSRAARVYPIAVAALLVLCAAGVRFDVGGPLSGIRAGLDWISRGDEFMAGVQESRPLVGPDAAVDLWEFLGLSIALLPIAWAAALWRTLRHGELALLPMVCIVPVAALLAATQLRFADALVVPMAVVVAWFLATAASRLEPRVRSATLIGAASALPLVLSQFQSISTAVQVYREDRAAPRERIGANFLGVRELGELLRTRFPPDSEHSVLSMWTWGHTLSWSAWRPTVSSNYGIYVGDDSYRDPARFLLADASEPAAAIELLERRRVRFVVASCELLQQFEHLCSIVEGGGTPLPRLPSDPQRHARKLLESSLAVRLVGYRPAGAQPLDFLRLVAVSRTRGWNRRSQSSAEMLPAAFLWERVPGALLQARAEPGAELRIELQIEFPGAGFTHEHVATATARADGSAELRVPYATDVASGDGRVRSARWSLGDRSGSLSITEETVSSGAPVVLR